MVRIALENMMAHKFRLFSTGLSVLLGVAFLAGSLVLIDTIQATFNSLFSEVNEEVDAEVRSADVIETDFADVRGRIDESLLTTVLEVPDVAAAAPVVFGFAQLVDPAGEPMGDPGQGAPTLGFSWTEVSELNPFDLTTGSRPPQAADEVVIDAKSARDGPFAVGDPVTVLLQGAPRQFTVVGIVRFGSADSPLGSSVAAFTLATAQEVLAEPGKVDVIDVVAAAGVSQQQLRDRLVSELSTAVPDGEVDVITGEALIEESQSTVADALSFFNTFMLIFAGIALFVASFIIYNTFSILVAQRTREVALLRALGARRHQILGSVLAEAVVVGAIASAIGVAAGLGIAMLLKSLLGAIGLEIPGGASVLASRTIWLSILVGIGVTSASALAPSWRAATVAPMAALRSVAVDDSGRSVSRLTVGSAMLAGGAALLGWGLFGSPPNAVGTVGSGAVLVFLAVAALGPVLALPFTWLVGIPLALLRGVPGELAQDNAMRNPKRTATTAAALMIGVGLVATISIFAASAAASINKIIDDSFIGDLVIDSGTFGFGGLSPDLAQELNELPQVAAASGLRLGFADIDGSARTIYGVDPDTMGSIVHIGIVEGRVEDLGAANIAVHQEFAADRAWQIGDTVDVTFAETGVRKLTIAVLYARDELTGDFFVGNAAYEANYADVFDFQVYIRRAAGADPAEARSAVERVADGFPNAKVHDLDEFKDAQADQINQLLNLVYALLALAVVIALIGIANTLALSILERTRELGLLRAVGMTRSQLRAAVRWESALIALLGTALGAAVGLSFGWVIVRALRDEGFTEFRLPIQQLVLVSMLATIAGVLAATQPARRASKLDILRAIGSG